MPPRIFDFVKLSKLLSNPLSFIGFIVSMKAYNFGALISFRPKFFRFPAIVIFNYCVRSIKNGLGTAVILFKEDYRYIWEFIFKFNNVPDVC